MEITIMETSAYLELKRQLSTLSVQMEEFNRKTAPPSPDKWIDAQEVCQALGISKRCLQAHRNRGLIPCSHIGGKYFYREADIQNTGRRFNKKQKITDGRNHYQRFGRV